MAIVHRALRRDLESLTNVLLDREVAEAMPVVSASITQAGLGGVGD